jgi:hypothetical protein
MDGRYFVHSLLRIVDKEMYHGIQSGQAFSSTGYLDVTAFNIINHKEVNLYETSGLYGQPVPIVSGDELPVYQRFLLTTKPTELICGVVGDNSSATRLTRLRLFKGISISVPFTNYTFDLGYYSVPVLIELTASSSEDVTEPRIWYPLIENYALAMASLGSGNTVRYTRILGDTYRLARMLVSNEYGDEAAKSIEPILRGGSGSGQE